MYMTGFFATAAAVWLHRENMFTGDRRQRLPTVCGRRHGGGGGSRLAREMRPPTCSGDADRLAGPRAHPRHRADRGTLTCDLVLLVSPAGGARIGRGGPLVAPAIMAAGGLCGVDRREFTTLGGSVAGVIPWRRSAAAAAAMAGLLVASVQRSQSRSSPPCARGTRRADTTSSR